MHYLRIVLLSAQVEVKVLMVDGFALAALIFQPLLVALAAMYMLRHLPDFQAVYVIVGTVLTALWTGALFGGSNALSGERSVGTLILLEASPTPLFLIVAGGILGNLAVSLCSIILGYVVASWLFGYSIAISSPIGFSISSVLAVLCLWATGMLFAPLSLVWLVIGRILTGLEYPVYALCGFLFPITLLPAWMQPVSYILPPSWAAVALHGTSSGGLSGRDLLRVWAFLFITCIITVLLALWLFRVLLIKARREGMLDRV